MRTLIKFIWDAIKASLFSAVVLILLYILFFVTTPYLKEYNSSNSEVSSEK